MDTARTDSSLPFVSPADLASRLGRADAPLVLDVRRAAAYDVAPRVIAGALRVAPDALSGALGAFPRGRSVVTYCVHGHEVSQNAARTLIEAGVDATFLEGGITAWQAAGLPAMAKLADPALPAAPGAPTRWITRARPKIDRIACPWLIRRFIDPSAHFLYVPSAEVMDAARRENAVPYDVPGVRFAHRGERCNFDALIEDCGLDDPALADLAAIVRGADTGKPELTPQSPGLLAISLGLSINFSDDHAMLEQGMVVYDALYSWVRSARAAADKAGKQ